MTNKSNVWLGWLGGLSICLSPHQLLAQTPTATTKNNPISYEDDRIRVAIQDCNRKLQELACQATLTSKTSDRTISLNPKNIKLVDFEGNEYYPSSLKLANRTSENSPIETELVENVPFKAIFIFNKIPKTVNKVALLQIPMGASMNAIAKFRNLNIVDPNAPQSPKNLTANSTSQPNSVAAKPATIEPEVSNDRSLICPDSTKILYRATSKNYLMYICGAKNPTHYVGISKDGSQGITLRLRYFDRSRFSADNGDTNYTIAANRLIIRKDNKIVYQEKIQVLQPLLDPATATDPTPSEPKLKKTTAAVESPNPKPKSKLKKTTAAVESPAPNSKPKSKLKKTTPSVTTPSERRGSTSPKIDR